MSSQQPIRKTCRRYNDPGDAHELTFSCFQRRPFLVKDRTRGYLTHAIREARVTHAFDLWGYVYMPEHAHVIIWPREDEYSVSRVLQSIKQSVSRRAVLYLKRHDPRGLRWLATGLRSKPYRFWLPGGGYDRNVIKPSTLHQAVEYLHNNPVRRGLVETPEEWYWSSAREWEEPGTGPLPIDRDSFPAL